MRFLMVVCAALAVLTNPARADDCDLRSISVGSSNVIVQRELFLCLMDQIQELREGQQQLHTRLAEAEAQLAEVPAIYINDNGREFHVTDRPVERATFILDARQTGGPSSRRIRQDVLEEMCATRDCLISVSVRISGVSGDTLPGSFIDGPCRFSYHGRSGVWLRGAGCSGGTYSGSDGNGVSAISDQGAEVILNADDMCLLADSDARDKVGSDSDIFERDHMKGLFLIATPDAQGGGTVRYRCELLIE